MPGQADSPQDPSNERDGGKRPVKRWRATDRNSCHPFEAHTAKPHTNRPPSLLDVPVQARQEMLSVRCGQGRDAKLGP